MTTMIDIFYYMGSLAILIFIVFYLKRMDKDRPKIVNSLNNIDDTSKKHLLLDWKHINMEKSIQVIKDKVLEDVVEEKQLEDEITG